MEGNKSSIEYWSKQSNENINGAIISGSKLRMSDGGMNEAHTAWFNTPVNIQSFTTDFTFQASAANADGFTFTIQNASQRTAAVGLGGGNLGYSGLGSSLAVKFDIYNNAGEGSNSTGFYTNGATPTTPALDLTSSGVSLHSGDVFQAHLTYNGTTLTLTLTDTATKAVFTSSSTVNLPSVVGANTALVGFTAGAGGLSAIQDILTWTLQ